MSSHREPLPDPMRGGPPAELTRLVRSTRGIQPWRRLLHALNGVVTVLALVFLFPGREALVVLGGLLLFLLGMDWVRLRDPRANLLFFRWFRVLASPREERGIASSTWYTVGVFLGVLLFPRSAVIPAILVLALADPAASVIGRRFGRRPLGKGSLEGSAVFALVAFLVLSPFVGAGVAALGALAAAAAEVLPVRLDDNLTVPLTVAMVLTLLGTT
jgi:dolichol kinase